MSLLKNPASAGEKPFDVKAERERGEAYIERHASTLSDIFAALQARRGVAGSSILRLARPVWLTVGTDLLESGGSPWHDGIGLYVDDATGRCQVKFSVSLGSTDENVVALMMAPLIYGLARVELLVGKLEALKATGMDSTHPDIRRVFHVAARLARAIDEHMVWIVWDRPAGDGELDGIPDEPRDARLH